MADVVVEVLFGKIISLLQSEASLIVGVRDEVSEMQRKLERMRAILRDTDRRSALAEEEKTWVADVRDTVYNLEDVIDEFMYHMYRRQGEGQFVRFFHRTVFLPKELCVRHQIATKLQKLNTKIQAISDGRPSSLSNPVVGGSTDDTKWLRNLRDSSRFTSDDDLVGIEDDKELLLRWLTDGDSQRTVISVVGMGGSGKTTLAAKAYNSLAVKRHFDSCAWITVSQTYEIEELFRNMIREFYDATKEFIPSNLSGMSYKELVEMLGSYLEPKRYIVVLDDVWDVNMWTTIKVLLPENRHGSRVLLTTRKEEIAAASFGVPRHVHRIQPLRDDDAWALLCKKAFSSDPNKCCPSQLESLGWDLVRKCNGLPLAIVCLGGVLASKELEQWEWQQVHDGLSWELNNNPTLEVVKSVLFLSFNDLPYRLKPCFLYCCIFPEDYSIGRKRLIRLWIAEGFVEEFGGLTAEEVGDNYLMELIRRSMLQVVQRNAFGRPRRCKMHDLMRELALSPSMTEKFCATYDGREEIEESGARRLSIQTSDPIIRRSRGVSQVRSFIVFFTNKFCSSFSIQLPTGFRLLRVLDLEGVPIEKLPDELVNLFNLRYLNLQGSQVKELPKSIGRLRNLQTLNIKDTNVEALPSGVAKLENLQCLRAYCRKYNRIYDFDRIIGVKAPFHLTKLKNLQVLGIIESEGDIFGQVKDMTQLKRFGIANVRREEEKDLCAAIERMNLLRYLSVKVRNEEEVLRMDALSSPPLNLRGLYLWGKLEKVPHWFQSLQSLARLCWSRLGEDPLPYIHALPNLWWLELFNAYGGIQLCFRTGFIRLEYFFIITFPLLNEIIIEQGVMPGLKQLELINCLELKTVPQGMEHLTNLQLLHLEHVPKELIEKISGEESVDRAKVQHIPKIIHQYKTSSGWSTEILS